MNNAKSKKIILVVVLVMVALVAILAFLNRGELSLKKELQTEQKFRIVIDETNYEVSMDDLKEIGIEDFIATVDTSTTDPHDVEFRGVEVKKIFEKFNIDTSNIKTLEFKSLDGYTSAVTAKEFNMDKNLYIAVERDGEPLGVKEDGGSGPYMMIVKSSKFSQRWCKFIQDIVVR